MDDALILGEIARLLLYQEKGVELLDVNYQSNAEAAEKLPPALVSFYQRPACGNGPATPEILKTLGIEERILKVQEK